MRHRFLKLSGLSIICILLIGSCQKKSAGDQQAAESTVKDSVRTDSVSISKPLVTHIYTADPSAHIFDGKIYVYPSHDIESGIPQNDLGDHFAMTDYHVLSLDSIQGKVTDLGVALDIKNIPWAGRQLWAPDAAFSKGKYYLYFPAKDKKDIFRIGVATSNSPGGPFVAAKTPMEGSYSIDPAVFKDSDGSFYMYFGGIWGGQLQRWNTGKYDPAGKEHSDDEPAIGPRVVKLSNDMMHTDGQVREIKILDQSGKTLLTKDHDRRFFEASWVYKYHDKYYFTYSTGDTHLIVYATGDSPMGPFTYQGVILKPVIGWTNHHSIVEVNGHWYLFYHDSELSKGQTHLRSVKVTELTHRPDGSIETINPYRKQN